MLQDPAVNKVHPEPDHVGTPAAIVSWSFVGPVQLVRAETWVPPKDHRDRGRPGPTGAIKVKESVAWQPSRQLLLCCWPWLARPAWFLQQPSTHMMSSPQMSSFPTW